MKLCSKCNTDNPQHANYCRRCGAKLNNFPEIEFFNYVSVPHPGDSIELSWNITNADSVILNGQTMPLIHQYKVIVDKEMTWELVAIKSGERVSKRIHIVPMQVSDEVTLSSVPSKVTPSDALPYFAKVLFIVLLIDIVPLILLLIISFCNSWLRYTLNLSYNEWNILSSYINILLWIWIIIGGVYGCFKFYYYKKDLI